MGTVGKGKVSKLVQLTDRANFQYLIKSTQ